MLIERTARSGHRRLWLRRLGRGKALRCAPVEVTVIDRTNHHLFQPLPYPVATGVVAGGDVAPPLGARLAKKSGAAVDRSGHVATLPDCTRVATLACWTIAFLGRGRPERTITEQQVFTRTHGMELGPAKIPR